MQRHDTRLDGILIDLEQFDWLGTDHTRLGLVGDAENLGQAGFQLIMPLCQLHRRLVNIRS